MSTFILITQFEVGVWKASDLNDGNSIFYSYMYGLHTLPVLYKQSITLKQYICVCTYH